MPLEPFSLLLPLKQRDPIPDLAVLESTRRYALFYFAVLVPGLRPKSQAWRRRVRLRLRGGLVHQVRWVRLIFLIRFSGRRLRLAAFGQQLLGVLRGRPARPRAGRRHDHVERHDFGGMHTTHSETTYVQHE